MAKATTAVEWLSASEEQTRQLGEQLGRLLQAGDVVALRGSLGSGKTTLTQGIVKGLGGDPESVKSPTFVLMREYSGPVPLIHVDAYRLEGAPAAAWLDVELLFSPHKVTVVEWAQRVEALLPEQTLTVQLEHVSTHRRRLRLAPSGERGRALLESARAWIDSNEAARD